MLRVAILLTFVLAWIFLQADPPADSTRSKSNVKDLPPLKAMMRVESKASPDTSRMEMPPYRLGFFCRFEDKMHKQWKLPINLELK